MLFCFPLDIQSSLSDLDLDTPRLTPIARSWLLESDAFSYNPQEGEWDDPFKSFLIGKNWLRPPSAFCYEYLFALTWLRLSAPTPEGISLYRNWVAAGCPTQSPTPSVPHSAFQSAQTPHDIGPLFWDKETINFMNVRYFATDSFPTEAQSVQQSVVGHMVNNFEDQLLHRTGELFQEQKRSMTRISLLLEAVALCESLVEICHN
jgi:hypothetical protein